MFVLMATGGLLVTANAGPIAQVVGLHGGGADARRDAQPARQRRQPGLLGWASDRLGRETAMVVAFVLQAICLFLVVPSDSAPAAGSRSRSCSSTSPGARSTRSSRPPRLTTSAPARDVQLRGALHREGRRLDHRRLGRRVALRAVGSWTMGFYGSALMALIAAVNGGEAARLDGAEPGDGGRAGCRQVVVAAARAAERLGRNARRNRRDEEFFLEPEARESWSLFPKLTPCRNRRSKFAAISPKTTPTSTRRPRSTPSRRSPRSTPTASALMAARIERRAARARDRAAASRSSTRQRASPRTDITRRRTRATASSTAARSPPICSGSGFRAPARPPRPARPVETSIRNVAYALLSGADGWMFDGEDALGQVSTMSLDNQRNLQARDPSRSDRS